MPQYVLILDAHAMDDFLADDMPEIDRAAHAVSQEAIDAGVSELGVDPTIEAMVRSAANHA